MKRALKIAALVLIISMTIWCNATTQSRKIKIYMDAPNEIGSNEEFSLQLLAEMSKADEEDNNYEFEWIKKAIKADYIITVIADRNPFPVAAKVGNVTDVCRQYVVTIVLDKIVDIKITVHPPGGPPITQVRRGVDPDKTNYMVNQQLGCDPHKIATEAVAKMETAMGLKPAAITRR